MYAEHSEILNNFKNFIQLNFQSDMKKIFQFAITLLIGCILAGCSEDETPGFGSIYGIVTDAKSSQPVYGATVVLSPGNQSTTTGVDGHYEFVDLEPGQYKIQVQASGYQVNSTQIQVHAGGQAIGDITVSPVDEISGIQLSTSTLNFDTNYTELTFSIRNTGNAGTVSWYINGINVSWLTVSPQQGETAMGKSSEVKVLIDRSHLFTSQSTTIIVNAAGGSQPITILVSTQSESGGNEGEGGEGSEGDEPEDYSSATITSCDYRVKAEIVSCKWSGSSVTFTYTLTNEGLGYVNDWRICPPSSISVIQGGTRSLITDNEGNEYPYPTMTFRTASTSGTRIINTSFPEDVPCKGTVTIKDVPTSVKSITAQIGVYAYPNTQFNMADSKVIFKNVPIY